MDGRFSRTQMLLGAQAFEKLTKARVAIFGIGGVGGYVCEALARSGVGTLDLFDRDVVSLSNINRQIIALSSTIGQFKTEAAAKRAKETKRKKVYILPLDFHSLVPNRTGE